jgi:flagellar biosynthesis/type III secretory pathway M-ring protein FliF/YscJ
MDGSISIPLTIFVIIILFFGAVYLFTGLGKHSKRITTRKRTDYIDPKSQPIERDAIELENEIKKLEEDRKKLKDPLKQLANEQPEKLAAYLQKWITGKD